MTRPVRRWAIAVAAGLCLGIITFIAMTLLGTKLFYCVDSPGSERCGVQSRASDAFSLIGWVLSAGVALMTTVEVQTILERWEARRAP